MLYHLNVKTTTFVNRNLGLFKTVADTVLDPTQASLRILEVGPGMAVRGVGRINHIGKWKVVKRFETVLRRLPMPTWCYENYETEELLRVFDPFSPHLTVADISRKSLDVIRRNITENLDETVRLDLSDADSDALVKLKNRFDLVICLATIVRVPKKSQAQAKRNLASFCAPGAIVITEQDMTTEGLEAVDTSNHVFKKSGK